MVSISCVADCTSFVAGLTARRQFAFDERKALFALKIQRRFNHLAQIGRCLLYESMEGIVIQRQSGRLKSRLFGCAAAMGLVIGCGTAAWGQSVSTDDTQKNAKSNTKANDEIVVTGTRIKQSNLVAPTPVKVIDEVAIEVSGETNAADILRQLPSIGVSALTTTNSNFTTTASGINTVQLRNLGEDRTLVLIDGRRVVSGVPGSQYVDFNSIPTEFIKRIDVLTGGSSAVYGSDALSGVINIILRDDYEGASLSYQHGQTAEFGDYKNNRLTASFGTEFADGRGNAMFGVTHSNNDGAYFRDRPGQGVDDLSYAFFTGSSNDVLTPVSSVLGYPFYSSFSEYGRINVIAPNNATASQWVTLSDGSIAPWSVAQYGFNRQAYRALAVPTERTLATSLLNYDLTDKVRLFGEFSYAVTDTTSSLEPFALANDDIYGAPISCDTSGCINGVPLTNPYIPNALKDQVRALYPGVSDENLAVGFARRLTEIDQRAATNKRQTARFVTGLHADISDQITLDASVNYGRTTQDQTGIGQVNVQNFANALDAIDDGSGNIVCRSVVAQNQGCVPINIFGLGNISEPAANYVRADSNLTATIEQFDVLSYLSGEISSPMQTGSFMSRPVSWVLGYEFRNEKSSFIPDALTQAGLNGGNKTPVTVGQFDVHEVFAELELPLLTDVPFAKAVDLRLAGRGSSYSTVGDTFAWSGNLQWQLNEMVKLRGQYASAVRAPNIGELFQGASETFGTVTDPCQGLVVSNGQAAFLSDITNPASAVDPGSVGSTVANNCLADPALAARVSRDGYFIPTQPELQGIGGFISGNPNLKEEDGESITFGAIINPKFTSWLEPLAISVDYFDIKITDAISTVSRQTSATRCYTRMEFCSNVRRFTTGSSVGAIDGVDSRTQNVAELHTSGVDVQFSYDFDVSSVVRNWNDAGHLTLTGVYQYLGKYTQVALPGNPENSFKGTLGLPENRGQFSLLYDREDLRFVWTTQWIGQSRMTGFIDSDFIVDDVFFHDINVRYKLPIPNVNASVFGGIDNVFNTFVPTGVGFNATGHYTAPEVYDALGRRFYVGAKVNF